MRFLLYTPHLYAVALLVLGFVASRLRQKAGYFWGALVIGEVARWGQVLFLVQNFGYPIYAIKLPHAIAPLSYTGLYVVAAAGMVGLLAGIVLYWRQKTLFPGGWAAVLSLAELLAAGVIALWV